MTFADDARHLLKVDPHLGKVIRAVGPHTLARKRGFKPYESLLRSIVYQQLSGLAARAIWNKVLALTPGKRPPTPEEILAMRMDKLRSAGLSRMKAQYIKDLARHAAQGLLPTGRALARMTDEELVKAFTAIKGIGVWSVEMMMIFDMGRPDVLPATDYGVRKGFAKVYGHAEPPPPKALLAHGEIWRPYRSVAAWYLWRALEISLNPSPAPART